MGYKSMTIKQSVNDIDHNRFYLPALQRKFVWGRHQIELLFDSLMRNYPIGTFLFWKLRKEKASDYVFYEFLREYDQRNPYNRRKTGAFTHDEICGVLDGQQRLSSLYVGLMGTHAERARYQRNDAPNEKKCLYLNLFSLPYRINDREDIEVLEEMNFEFRFLSQDEAERADWRTVRVEDDGVPATDRNEPLFWLKVGEVLSWPNDPDLDKYVDDIEARCVNATDRKTFVKTNRRIIKKGLDTLYKRMCTDSILNYFEIEKDDLEDILKIFTRVNSGGTILGKTDLLFSTIVATWDDGREKIEELLKEINSMGEGFNFTNEYLMRCCLMLTDAAVVYRVNSFRTENVERIQTDWPNIAGAVRKTVGLLTEFGFNGSLLTSQNATIIIAYHIYRGGNLERESKDGIRKYLVHALLTHIFSSSQDQLLAALRNSLRTEVASESGTKTYALKSSTFSFNDLASGLTSRRSLSVDENDIESFLERKKGPDAFAVLSVLYPNMRFQTVVFHQDHIHPASRFNADQFAELRLSQDAQAHWLKRRDTVANLQLLEGRVNQEKSATPLAEWIRCMPEEDRTSFCKANYFPEGVAPEFANFEEFYEKRRKLMLERLRKELEITAIPSGPSLSDSGEREDIDDEEARGLLSDPN